MALTAKVKQQLKGQAHKLKPVVFIGIKGLTKSVLKEIDQALDAHELIKVRIQGEDREARRLIFAEISTLSSAALVQTIGSIGVFYRKCEE